MVFLASILLWLFNFKLSEQLAFNLIKNSNIKASKLKARISASNSVISELKTKKITIVCCGAG